MAGAQGGRGRGPRRPGKDGRPRQGRPSKDERPAGGPAGKPTAKPAGKTAPLRFAGAFELLTGPAWPGDPYRRLRVGRLDDSVRHYERARELYGQYRRRTPWSAEPGPDRTS